LTIEVNAVLRNTLRDLEKIEAVWTASIGPSTSTRTPRAARWARRGRALIQVRPERKDTKLDADISAPRRT